MTAVPRKTPAIRKVASELPAAAKASAPDNQYAVPTPPDNPPDGIAYPALQGR